MILLLVSVLATLAAVPGAHAATRMPSVMFYSGIENMHASRVVDISTHVEEVVYKLQAKNSGSEAATYYLFAMKADKMPNLAYVRGFDKKGGDLATDRVVVKGIAPPAPKGTTFFKIQLPSTLQPGGTVSLEVRVSYTRVLEPFPAQIQQGEPQLVLYRDNKRIFSAYRSATQKTTIKLYNSNIESYTKKGGSIVGGGNRIVYGVAEPVDAYSHVPLKVHYENNHPFVTMTTLDKDIEVSHWGNVAVEEKYVLTHTGARLTGEWSRNDYDKNKHSSTDSSYHELTALLPASATDVYFRDHIGNVSSSHVRQERNHVRLEVQPRFPMFGGWKADFYIGYNAPASHYLNVAKNDGNLYVLDIPMGSPFAAAAIDDLKVRLILPEGATDIQWKAPFEMDVASHDIHVSYLDTQGRPVLVLAKHNTVWQHNQNVQVTYRFSSTHMYKEPMLLMGFFFSLFAAAMVYVRMDMSIDSSEKRVKTD